MIVEVYKPEFTDFHEKPIVTWQESRGPIRVAVNMFAQYTSWLNHWTDPFRGKFAPGPAFWETSGPAICRALSYCDARALVFEWESDRKVAYRWFARTPESPTRFKNDYYSLCSVTATSRSSGESHVVVTLPTDEDVSFSFRSDSMKEWLQPKLPEEPKP